jgi:hypothetical protein
VRRQIFFVHAERFPQDNVCRFAQFHEQPFADASGRPSSKNRARGFIVSPIAGRSSVTFQVKLPLLAEESVPESHRSPARFSVRQRPSPREDTKCPLRGRAP